MTLPNECLGIIDKAAKGLLSDDEIEVTPEVIQAGVSELQGNGGSLRGMVGIPNDAGLRSIDPPVCGLTPQRPDCALTGRRKPFVPTPRTHHPAMARRSSP